MLIFPPNEDMAVFGNHATSKEFGEAESTSGYASSSTKSRTTIAHTARHAITHVHAHTLSAVSPVTVGASKKQKILTRAR